MFSKDIILTILLALAVLVFFLFTMIYTKKNDMNKRKYNSFEYNHMEISEDRILAIGRTTGKYIGEFPYLIFTRPDSDKLFFYTGGEPISRNGKLYICIHYIGRFEDDIKNLDDLTDEIIERSGYNIYMNAAR